MHVLRNVLLCLVAGSRSQNPHCSVGSYNNVTTQGGTFTPARLIDVSGPYVALDQPCESIEPFESSRCTDDPDRLTRFA